MSILGNRVLRTEDDRFLRGKGQYVENLALEGARTITFVRSLYYIVKVTLALLVASMRRYPRLQGARQ